MSSTYLLWTDVLLCLSTLIGRATIGLFTSGLFLAPYHIYLRIPFGFRLTHRLLDIYISLQETMLYPCPLSLIDRFSHRTHKNPPPGNRTIFTPTLSIRIDINLLFIFSIKSPFRQHLRKPNIDSSFWRVAEILQLGSTDRAVHILLSTSARNVRTGLTESFFSSTRGPRTPLSVITSYGWIPLFVGYTESLYQSSLPSRWSMINNNKN